MSLVIFEADLARLIAHVRMIPNFSDPENRCIRRLVDGISNGERELGQHLMAIQVLCNKIRQRAPLYIIDQGGHLSKNVLHDLVSRVVGKLQGTGMGILYTPSIKTTGLVIDVETTDITPDAHIISIAWVYVVDSVPVETVEHLIYPTFDGPVPDASLQIHNIKREQLEADGKPLLDVMMAFAPLVSRADWFATYGGSDKQFLCTALKRVAMDDTAKILSRLPFVDVLMYGRYWLNEYPANPNHRTLSSVYQAILGKPLLDKHTSIGDAKAASELFSYLRHHIWEAMERGPVHLECRPGPAYAQMWIEDNWWRRVRESTDVEKVETLDPPAEHVMEHADQPLHQQPCSGSLDTAAELLQSQQTTSLSVTDSKGFVRTHMIDDLERKAQ